MTTCWVASAIENAGLWGAIDLSRGRSRERLLIIGDAEDTAAPASIILVQNWFEELRRLVPTN